MAELEETHHGTHWPGCYEQHHDCAIMLVQTQRKKLATAQQALLQIRDSTHQPAVILRGIAGRALEGDG